MIEKWISWHVGAKPFGILLTRITKRRKKNIEEEDTITNYLRSMRLGKNLLQQTNAGSYSSQGAAGESNRQCKQENTWETMGDEA